MNDDKFEQFIAVCAGHLGHSKDILKLVKKRYDEADPDYTNSSEFEDLIVTTEKSIEDDKKRLFVHLRDFMNILKERKCPANDIFQLKRQYSDDSEQGPPHKRARACSSEDEDSSKALVNGTGNKEDSHSSESGSEGGGRISETVSRRESGAETSSSEVTDNEHSEEEDSDKESSIDDRTVNDTDQSSNSTEHDDSSHETNSTHNECDLEEETIETVTDDESSHKNEKDITKSSDGEEESFAICADDNASSRDNDVTTSPNVECDKEEKQGSDRKHTWEEDLGFSSDGSDLPDINFPIRTVRTKDSSHLSNHEVRKEKDDDHSVGNESEYAKTKTNLESASSCLDDNHKGKWQEQSGNDVIILEDDQKEKSGDSEKCLETATEGRQSSVGKSCSTVKRSLEKVGNDGNLRDEMESHAASACSDKESEISAVSDKTDNEDSEVETKRKAVHYITSSDEDDPYYAENARKAREKCKKKYVISVGKKKGKKTPIESKTTDVRSSTQAKNPMKKTHKARSPKRISPKKSPIIIVTDSNTSCDSEGDDRGSGNHHNNTSDVDSEQKTILKKAKVELYDSLSSKQRLSLNKNESEINETVQENESKDTEVVEKKRIAFQTETLYSKGTKVKHKASSNESGTGQCSSRDSKSVFKRDKMNEHGYNDPKPSTSSGTGARSEDGEQTDKKKGSSKQIKRLELLLESIRNQIEQVRTRELDLDALESEVSDYILEDKLKKKFVKVYEKLCSLHNAMPGTGRATEKYFKYQGTRYPDINRKLEKFINRRKQFPDYHDVLNIIMKVSKAKHLRLSGRNMDDLAREAFTDIGNQLQQRRQKDMELEDTHATVVDTKRYSKYDDPALFDPALKRKLESNKKQAKSNMQQVLDKYAALQYCTDDKTDDDEEEEEEEEEDIALEEEEEEGSRPESDIAIDTAVLISEEETTTPCLQIENVTCGKRRYIHDVSDLYSFSPTWKKKIGEEMVKYTDAKSEHFGTMLGLTQVQSSSSLDAAGPEMDEEHLEEEVIAKPSNNEAECCNNITIITDDEDDTDMHLKICSPRHVSTEIHDKMGSGTEVPINPVLNSVHSLEKEVDKHTDQLKENSEIFDEVIELDKPNCFTREMNDSKAKCVTASGQSFTNVSEGNVKPASRKSKFPRTNSQDVDVIMLDEDDEYEQINMENGCRSEITKKHNKDDGSGRSVSHMEVTSIAAEFEETFTTKVDESPGDNDNANISIDCGFSMRPTDSVLKTIPSKTVVEKSKVSGAKSIPPLKSIPNVTCDLVIPSNADIEQKGALQGKESGRQRKVFTEKFGENTKPVYEVPDIICLDEEQGINTEEQTSNLKIPGKERRNICNSKNDHAEPEQINRHEVMNSFGSDFTEISLGSLGPCSPDSPPDYTATKLVSEIETSEVLADNMTDLEKTIEEDSSLSNPGTLCRKGADTVISQHVNETNSHVENAIPQEQANGDTSAKCKQWNHAELDNLIKSLDSPTTSDDDDDDNDDSIPALNISKQVENPVSDINTSVNGDDDNDTGSTCMSRRSSSISDIFTDPCQADCDNTIENVNNEDIESDDSVKSDSEHSNSNDKATSNENFSSIEHGKSNENGNCNEINSTSVCSEQVFSVRAKLTRPDVRSKLQQLEQAVKVHKLKVDSGSSPSLSKSSKLKVEPAWNTEDEHVALIETYTEPDSSICIDEEQVVSSSGLVSKVIVLSDSE